MALSKSLRDVIFLLNIIQELKNHQVQLLETQPTIHCQVYEDNAGAIELAKCPKLRPHTKYIAIQYHHFQHWMVPQEGEKEPQIKVEYINTKEQEADLLTKPLPRISFQYLCTRLCSW